MTEREKQLAEALAAIASEAREAAIFWDTEPAAKSFALIRDTANEALKKDPPS